jgi:hypothetical protein
VKVLKTLVIVVSVMAFCSGCGVGNVVTRGEYIDAQSIKVGTPRVELLSRFGAPAETKKNGDVVISDIFRIVQGEYTASKVLKGAGILALDVFTWGLSEAIFTPVTNQKDHITFEVKYDADQKVSLFRIISGE